MSYIGSFYSVSLDDEYINYDGNGCGSMIPTLWFNCGSIMVNGTVSFFPDKSHPILCLYVGKIASCVIDIPLDTHTSMSKFADGFYTHPSYKNFRYYPSDRQLHALQNAVEHLMSDSEFVTKLETALKTIMLQDF